MTVNELKTSGELLYKKGSISYYEYFGNIYLLFPNNTIMPNVGNISATTIMDRVEKLAAEYVEADIIDRDLTEYRQYQMLFNNCTGSESYNLSYIPNDKDYFTF